MTASVSNPPYLLDTSALMALIEDEPGAERVDHVLRNERVFVPFLVALETYYVTLQERSEDEADRRFGLIRQLAGTWLDQVSDQVLLVAGKIKARCRVSLADALVAAFAWNVGATLVHKDPEFETVADFVSLEALPYRT